MADIKHEIVQHIAVISDKGNGWLREVNLVKWNDMGVKVDIRDWNSSRKSMRKGITLNKQEFLTLVKSFRKINAADLSDAEPGFNPGLKAEGPTDIDPECDLDAAANG